MNAASSKRNHVDRESLLSEEERRKSNGVHSKRRGAKRDLDAFYGRVNAQPEKENPISRSRRRADANGVHEASMKSKETHRRASDSAARRQEERDFRHDMEQLRSLEHQRSMLLSVNAALRSDNAVVGGIIAATCYLQYENNPLVRLLLTQHILYETHRYTLKLLQNEVFVTLRQELTAERTRDYILERLILPDDDDDNGASVDLDQLVNILRGLPAEQLTRLLRPLHDL
jgi:hypothetical protein